MHVLVVTSTLWNTWSMHERQINFIRWITVEDEDETLLAYIMWLVRLAIYIDIVSNLVNRQYASGATTL